MGITAAVSRCFYCNLLIHEGNPKRYHSIVVSYTLHGEDFWNL